MLNLLTRERLLIISGVLLVLLAVGVFLYIRAASQADEAYREGQIREEQVFALQEQAKRTQALGEAREAERAEELEQRREESLRVSTELGKLRRAIPKQSAQEAIEGFRKLLKVRDVPPPVVSTDKTHISVPVETLKAYELQLVDLTEEAAKVRPLEAEVLLLREQSGNLAELLAQEKAITFQLEETVSAFKRSAKKGRFRRMVGKIAPVALLVTGIVVGSKF